MSNFAAIAVLILILVASGTSFVITTSDCRPGHLQISSSSEIAEPELHVLYHNVKASSLPNGLIRREGMPMFYAQKDPGQRPGWLDNRQFETIKKLSRSSDLNVAAAALLMGGGELDEAHEIVQYRSEPNAKYIHALLHRLEGPRFGELGLKGWSNSCYWWNELGYHPLFADMLAYVQSRIDRRSSPVLRAFLSEMEAENKWDPEKFVMLCARAVRDDGPTGEVDAFDFCQDVSLKEWDMLYHHILNEAKTKTT